VELELARNMALLSGTTHTCICPTYTIYHMNGTPQDSKQKAKAQTQTIKNKNKKNEYKTICDGIEVSLFPHKARTQLLFACKTGTNHYDDRRKGPHPYDVGWSCTQSRGEATCIHSTRVASHRQE
jgi:hypothetical protein